MCTLKQSVLLSVLAIMFVAVCAPAALIGIQPTFPIMMYNGGGVSYNASTNTFMIDTSPLAVRFSALTPPRFVQPVGGIKRMSLSLQVDEAGVFIGATPGGGHGFIVEGQVDEDGCAK